MGLALGLGLTVVISTCYPLGKAGFRPDQQYTVYVFLISIIIRFSFSKKSLSFSISFAKISLYYTGRNVVQGEDYRCRRAGSILLRDVSHASLVARRYTPVSLAYSLPSAVYSSHSDKPENENANFFRHARAKTTAKSIACRTNLSACDGIYRRFRLRFGACTGQTTTCPCKSACCERFSKVRLRSVV